MRLLHLRVRGFKRMRDMELDLSHDRLLVVGPNEAGKSTLMEALLTGLYGLAPAKRGSGHTGALKLVLPWTGEPAGLSLTYELDDGRQIEVDWDLSGERTQVIDHTSGEDISGRFITGTHGWLDVGDALLHLPSTVFAQVSCVGEGELALITDDVVVRQSLLRVTDSGVDVLVEQALRRLQEAARQASIPKVNAATRLNELVRHLTAAESQLASARSAREALEGEVEIIHGTEQALERSHRQRAEILVEEERRVDERTRLGSEVERARTRLAEAGLLLASLQHERREAEPGRSEWTDDEVEDSRMRLVEAPATRIPRPTTLLALGSIAIGLAALVGGVVARLTAGVAVGAVLVAIGVYLATRGGLPGMRSLTVGSMSFRNRKELMAALEHERGRRDYAEQLAATESLQQRLDGLHQQPSAVGTESLDAATLPLAELADDQLERRSMQAAKEQQRLTIELAQLRASLERGARLIPEVAPLEERALALRAQVEQMDAFGLACRMAVENLAEGSEEIRRAYAPKLQAYLGRDLARITEGRYTEALVNEKFEVLLRAPETKTMVDLRRISRGTQQQIYLLLRLGLLEVMSSGTETLPLFLDDALALADDDRRSELLKVLESEKRQVIYFTAGERGAAAAFGPQWHRMVLPRPAAGAAEGAAKVGSKPLRVVEHPGSG
jgi:DNA repair exonuclease SbcCD ATPase subunit